MIVIAVMYPAANGANFDHAYYHATHMPLVRRLWEPLGLQSAQVLRGTPGADGSASTYMVTALLSFGSMDEFKAAARQHGAEIFADIPKFTDCAPVLQFNEVVTA